MNTNMLKYKRKEILADLRAQKYIKRIIIMNNSKWIISSICSGIIVGIVAGIILRDPLGIIAGFIAGFGVASGWLIILDELRKF